MTLDCAVEVRASRAHAGEQQTRAHDSELMIACGEITFFVLVCLGIHDKEPLVRTSVILVNARERIALHHWRTLRGNPQPRQTGIFFFFFSCRKSMNIYNQSGAGGVSDSRPDVDTPAKLVFGIGTDNLVTLLVFGLIFALGVVGNSLVIAVLVRRRAGQRRGTTNIFIFNLGVADLSYLLFCVPFQSTVYMLPTWVLGAFICKFVHYFFTVSMLVSVFTLSAMSVDRYVAIVHSRKSSSIRVPRHALLGVLGIWALSLAMASPVAYHQRIVETEDNSTFCWEVWSDPKRRKIYVVCTFVFGYLLPLILISFCYAKVIILHDLEELQEFQDTLDYSISVYRIQVY